MTAPGPSGIAAIGRNIKGWLVARFKLGVFLLKFMLRAMELLTILNCHHHRVFVYQSARFSGDKKANSPTWAGMFLDFWRFQTMRSRIEPMKKITRTLLLNYFKARKQISSGVVGGLNNRAKSHHEKIVTAFAPFVSWHSRSIARLASYQSPSLPMNSSDES